MGVLYLVEDLVGVYLVCLIIKKKILMWLGVVIFVVMWYMNDWFIWFYWIIDFCDWYFLMYFIIFVMLYCGLNLVKGSWDNFWGFFLNIKNNNN